MADIQIAAAYIRVSTDDQAELSPDSQIAVIRDYAGKNGIVIPEEHVYIDEGISGRRAAKRPAFNRMIAAARGADHPFDSILVWKFSRFARNQEESIVYKAMLRKDGVEVVSVSEPLVEGPFGSLIERILEWMDEYYSIRLSGEVKRSMTLNAQRGVRQTAPPFGYVLRDEDGERSMVPEPQEAALVREMFSRFIGGEGLYQIARRMNSMGAKTHRGSPFENRTVEYILTNPAYIGKARWTPSGRAGRGHTGPDTIIADAGHEPLIDSDTWDAAQDRMKAVKEQWGYKARPTYELKDWLGGVVRCAECGTTLVFVRPHYFKCNNYVRGRCRSSQHIRTDLLHEALIGRLIDDSVRASPLEYQISVRDADGHDAIQRLSVALTTLDRKLERIRKSYAAGIDSLEDYRRYRSEVEAEERSIQEQIASLQERQDPQRIDRDLREHLKQAIEILKDPEATKEKKNGTVRELLASCHFNKNGMDLELVYRVSF